MRVSRLFCISLQHLLSFTATLYTIASFASSPLPLPLPLTPPPSPSFHPHLPSPTLLFRTLQEFHEKVHDFNIGLDNVSAMELLSVESHLSSIVATGALQLTRGLSYNIPFFATAYFSNVYLS